MRGFLFLLNATYVQYYDTAAYNDLLLTVSAASILAPWSMSSFTISACPSHAANLSGVLLFWYEYDDRMIKKWIESSISHTTLHRTHYHVFYHLAIHDNTNLLIRTGQNENEHLSYYWSSYYLQSWWRRYEHLSQSAAPLSPSGCEPLRSA